MTQDLVLCCTNISLQRVGSSVSHRPCWGPREMFRAFKGFIQEPAQPPEQSMGSLVLTRETERYREKVTCLGGPTLSFPGWHSTPGLRYWPPGPASLYPTGPPHRWRMGREPEDGPSAPRLPASASEIPGLGSRKEGPCPAGPCPTSPGPVLSPQLAGMGGGEGGRSDPGAEPAESNLIEQETGLQPDKASPSTWSLCSLAAGCKLSQAPAAGPQEHLGQEGAPTGSGFSAKGSGLTCDPEGGLVT